MNSIAVLLFAAVAGDDPLRPEDCSSTIATDSHCRTVLEHMVGRDENSPYTKAEVETIMECDRAADAARYCGWIAKLCDRALNGGHAVDDVPLCERWQTPHPSTTNHP